MKPSPDLYTARWHVRKGLVVPDGGPRRELLKLLEGTLGPEPGAAPVTTAETLPTSLDVDWLVEGDDFPIVGRPFGEGRLAAYVAGFNPDRFRGKFKPTRICIHHTGAPSLGQRPDGFTEQHMRNLRDYYRGKGWSAGPHWFVDDHQAWAFTPMTERGVHAVSFNRDAIGIEMLGNYDIEDPASGRGAEVIRRTGHLVALLMGQFDIPAADILFHRDDPQTDKTCPGGKIARRWFLTHCKL